MDAPNSIPRTELAVREEDMAEMLAERAVLEALWFDEDEAFLDAPEMLSDSQLSFCKERDDVH